ncbi:hypothetical protein [Nitrosomonas communis]|uniref:hypothetical protein n=1 Tax=Nitrosomonas communis TaxID=44574 RepID=UPI0026EFC38B|nr:hypothetical protein [Nitrosomonas communis]MCO6427127.1 hypothetical protein [Nitrosomonas communis]
MEGRGDAIVGWRNFDHATKDKGHDESRPLSMTTTNGGGMYPSRIARHQLDGALSANREDFNQSANNAMSLRCNFQDYMWMSP